MRGLLGLCLCFLAALPLSARAGEPHHDLKISLNPATRQLQAEDTITLSGRGTLRFLLAPQLSMGQILLDNKAVPVASAHGGLASGLRLWQLALGDPVSPHRIKLNYRGELASLQAMDQRDVLSELPAMVDEEGSYLPAGSGWYPTWEEGTFTYKLALDLPQDQRGLAPGRLVKEERGNGRYRAWFEFTHPAEGIDLMAGPYRIKEGRGQGPSLRTYFHPEIADLAPDYLDSISGYLKLYNAWIGPYPFTEFSIVSSPLPTGFGMPTLTYLGIDVLRLPFIRFGSLGHEILHNWWGNGVYVDWEHGNWSEGLTTFMADYTYKEREGAEAARETRLSWLRDFAAIPEGQDQPLVDFTARHHSASQIVGYDKAAFVFLMLRDRLGTRAFDDGIRRFWKERQFRASGWGDLRYAFEKSAGEKLENFFAQWLTRQGAPKLALENVKATPDIRGKYRVSFTLTQQAPAYTLRVPVGLKTAKGTREQIVDFSQTRAEYILESKERPLSLTLDPDFRLFRRINPAELPPILRQVVTDPAISTLIATRDNAARNEAKTLATQLLDNPPHFLDNSARFPTKSSALLIIGTSAEVGSTLERFKLPPQPAQLRGKGTAQVWATRQVNGRVLVVVSARDAQALRALIRPLPHYGRQSFLVFENNKVIERGVWPAQSRQWVLSTQ